MLWLVVVKNGLSMFFGLVVNCGSSWVFGPFCGFYCLNAPFRTFLLDQLFKLYFSKNNKIILKNKIFY